MNSSNDSHRKKVLITEDDPGILDVLTIIFQRAGYDVTPFSDGNMLLKGTFEVPGIFLLDKQLSGVDGLDLCRHLKKAEPTKDIPVIILSATPYIKQLSAQAGADAFIEKPFSNKEIVQLVENLVNHSSTQKGDS